jgi:hypothetical protein
MPVDPSVARYREQFRVEENCTTYPGWLHFAFTSAVSIAVVILCLVNVEQVRPLEWLTIPVVFLYANLVEYLGHRGPMHHPVKGLGLIFYRHTKQHHRFFTNREMTFDSSNDHQPGNDLRQQQRFQGGAVSAGDDPVLPRWIRRADVAHPVLRRHAAIAYFLNYEWLHFAYHCDPESRIGRIPGVQTLRKLHRQHHDQQLMSHYNFNITYPIGDWIFRTIYR